MSSSLRKSTKLNLNDTPFKSFQSHTFYKNFIKFCLIHMKNFRSPIHSPSFLSVSTPSPKPSEALIDDQLTKTQDLFDNLFDYVSCANGDITEVFSFEFLH